MKPEISAPQPTVHDRPIIEWADFCRANDEATEARNSRSIHTGPFSSAKRDIYALTIPVVMLLGGVATIAAVLWYTFRP